MLLQIHSCMFIDRQPQRNPENNQEKSKENNWRSLKQPGMCSVNIFDNLSVEAGKFYHFRGLILCNMNHIQLIRYKKQ